MCGITGAFAIGGGRLEMEPGLLGRMTDALAHRGPDDRDTHLDAAAGIALGHRRLSIVDLTAAGRQPMASDDGAVRIVYNGEVYNHADLRAELEARGHRFRSRTDTEVILRLYETEGDGFLHRLHGMFALAIHDARRERLLLARDRIGVKPLVWWREDGLLLFASEPRALLEHPRVPRRVAGASLRHALTFLSTPAPGTLFDGIYKLPAGHRLVANADGVSVERWWDPLDAPALAPELMQDSGAAAEAIRERLRASVRERMMSDVPFGVFLSGGIDSSLNVAFMAEASPLPVETFSVGYAGAGVEELNELAHARRVAASFGARHHEVMIDGGDALALVPDLVEHLDEPVFDPVCVPLLAVSRLARGSGVKVIQVGEGSDELFVGYPTWLQAIRFADALGPLPRAARRGLYAAAGPALRAIGRRAGDWAELLRRAAHEAPFLGGAIQLTDPAKAPLLGPRAAGPSAWSVVEGFYADIARRWPDADAVQRMTYIELRQRLPELLLMRLDKVLMATGIEGREPFLDHRLVELALRLPRERKLGHGTTKTLLKRAIRGILPDDLIDRRKQGFPAPTAHWLLDPAFERRLRETLAETALVSEGFIDGATIARWLDDHFSRRRLRGGPLWTLFVLALWHRRWIQNWK